LLVGLNTGIILKVSLDKNEEHSCEHALQSFHTETITGLDVCLRKSLVATCSSDRTVRIWNYL
jgi:WD40 repeat protein